MYQHLANRMRQLFHEMGDFPEQRNAVVLIASGDEGRLPWEGIPILINQPVCRMPSLVSLIDAYRVHPEPVVIDPSSVAYLLNPTDDLPGTQRVFAPYFNRQGWHGITGCVPSEQQFRSLLEEHDLFVYVCPGFAASFQQTPTRISYCGHNSGERFMSAMELQKLRRCAVALLMGCSSARIDAAGELEPSGLPHCYLLSKWYRHIPANARLGFNAPKSPPKQRQRGRQHVGRYLGGH
jgi:separase